MALLSLLPALSNARRSALREAWNYTTEALEEHGYPFDCVLLAKVHEASRKANPSGRPICPPLPEHMLNISGDIARERANWTDTPEECVVAADGDVDVSVLYRRMDECLEKEEYAAATLIKERIDALTAGRG